MIDELGVIQTENRLRRIATWYEAGDLTPTLLNDLLAEWWTNGGWPDDMGTRRLVKMFKDAGFVTDTEGVTPPTEPLVLYRGAGVHNYRGLAWTTDETVAAWFARKLVWLQELRLMEETAPCLFSVTVPPRHILGIFHGRNEAEVIVNPFGLRGRLKWGSGIRAVDERVIRLAEERNRSAAARQERMGRVG